MKQRVSTLRSWEPTSATPASLGAVWLLAIGGAVGCSVMLGSSDQEEPIERSVPQGSAWPNSSPARRARVGPDAIQAAELYDGKAADSFESDAAAPDVALLARAGAASTGVAGDGP
jgi:hypothetical protein